MHINHCVCYTSACPEPGISNSSLLTPSKPSYDYKKSFTVKCPTGYVFSSQEFVGQDSVTMTCGYAKQWNVRTSPTCARKFRI